MSWDAIITGELKFPQGSVKKWREAQGLIIDYGWPPMIAQAIVEDDDDEPHTVSELLATSARLNHFFGTIDGVRDGASIRFIVDRANYFMVGDIVVRLACAAADAGGSGRILFCDLGDAQISGLFKGALITVGRGKVVAEEKDEALTPKDKALVDVVINERMAKVGRDVAARRAKKTPPKKTPPKKTTKKVAKRRKR
jgi:hypothetical protein